MLTEVHKQVVKFEGGPYNGQSKWYAFSEVVRRRGTGVIGCFTDAHAQGFHGLYNVDTRTGQAKWKDVPFKAVAGCKCERCNK